MKKADLYQLILEYKKSLKFYQSEDDRIKLLREFLFSHPQIKLLRDDEEVNFLDFDLFMRGKNKKLGLTNLNDPVVEILNKFMGVKKIDAKDTKESSPKTKTAAASSATTATTAESTSFAPKKVVSYGSSTTPTLFPSLSSETDLAKRYQELGCDVKFADSLKRNKRIKDHDAFLRALKMYRSHCDLNDINQLSPWEISCLTGDPVAIQTSIAADELKKDTKNNIGTNAFHVALMSGSISGTQYVLNELKIDPNSTNKYGTHALYYAIWGGNILTVQFVMDELGKSLDRDSLLSCATANGNPKLIEFITLKITPTLEEKEILLVMAAKHGHPPLMQYAVDKLNVNPKHTDKINGNALQYAAFSGDVPTIKFCVNTLGIDPHETKQTANNVALITARSGKLDALKYVLDDLHIDAKVTDTQKNNLIINTAAKGTIEAIQYVVKKSGIDPKNKNSRGENALMRAAQSNRNLAVIQYLIHDLEINILDTDRDGRNALHHAASCGNVPVIRYLRQCANDLHVELDNVCDNEGNTPLKAARYWDDTPAVKEALTEKLSASADSHYKKLN